MRNPVEGRLQRLLAVLAWLASEGPAPLADLAARFDVSTHQLTIDFELANLCELPGAPDGMIDVLIDDDGWVHVDPPHYLARQPRLTRQEGFAVLTTGRAALGLDPTLADLESAMAKLADVLGIDADLAIDLDPPPALELFRRAVDEHERLSITYWSAWRDERTTREVDPLLVSFLDGAWYCLAADHASGELRRFRLDRVQDTAPTGETFAPTGTPTTDLAAPFDAPAQAVAVRVWLPEDARWVAEYVPLTEVVDAVAAPAQAPPGSGTGYTATVTTVGTSFLARLLVRARGQVIDPPDWRDLTRQAAADILAGYDDPA